MNKTASSLLLLSVVAVLDDNFKNALLLRLKLVEGIKAYDDGPDRETALANSCSLEFPVEATYNRHALINGTHPAKHRPDGENRGHNCYY